MPRTLYQKIWDRHVVARREDGACLIWIDRHLIHEVTSPQAFEGLRLSGRRAARPELALAMPDHNVPTTAERTRIADPQSAAQVAQLARNAEDFGIEHIGVADRDQGVVHVVGPEQGFTLPGLTIVCGDSHTSTHGAFGALAFGVGASEVEHVLATQTLAMRPSRTLEVRIAGALGPGVTAKDLALAVVAALGAAGGVGHVIEFTGPAVRALSMEGRMTLCNMAIEAGARSGLIAPDETTFAYLQGRPRAPRGPLWAAALADWRELATDPGAAYDRVALLDAAEIAPSVTWGVSPADVVPITGRAPSLESFADPVRREAAARALAYMGLEPGQALQGLAVENVFIGSCTNGRLEDLRAAAAVVRGRRVAGNVRQALVVPGSGRVRAQAEAEGLDRVFVEAGFEWREPGCSMCLGMNPDQVPAGERCASTSNRNFVGRQGPGARTHLMSPPMAAAAAIDGRLADVRAFTAG